MGDVSIAPSPPPSIHWYALGLCFSCWERCIPGLPCGPHSSSVSVRQAKCLTWLPEWIEATFPRKRPVAVSWVAAWGHLGSLFWQPG